MGATWQEVVGGVDQLSSGEMSRGVGEMSGCAGETSRGAGETSGGAGTPIGSENQELGPWDDGSAHQPDSSASDNRLPSRVIALVFSLGSRAFLEEGCSLIRSLRSGV